MAYTNINVGQSKNTGQTDWDNYVSTLISNKKRDRSRRGLERSSNAFKPETASDAAISDAYENAGFADTNDEWIGDYQRQAEQEETVAGLVAKAERTVSPEESEAKEVSRESARLADLASEAAANHPNREGWNPQGSIMSGPANVHYTDMDRVNKGLMPSRADELRDSMNSDSSYEEAARMLPYEDSDAKKQEMNIAANVGVIATQAQLSEFVSNQMTSLSTGFGSSTAQEFIDRVAKDTNQDPQSVGEWFQTVLTDHKTLKDEGIPEVFSDAALAAVLHVMKKNRWSQFNRDEKMVLAEGALNSNDSESEVNTSIAHDEQIGGLIETAFGKKDSTAQTRAITGAIARRVVTDALGGYELNNKAHGMTLNRPDLATPHGQRVFEPISGRTREVSPEGYMKAGLFHSKKIKIKGSDDLWVTELTDIGLNYAVELEGLGNIILPGLRKDVNSRPPQTEEGFDQMSSNKTQRREDERREAGPAKDTNRGIHAMESVGNAIDKTFGDMLLATLDNKEATDILIKESDYINLVGLTLPSGEVIRVGADGNAFAQEYRLDLNGDKIPNPRYNPENPNNTELEFETKTLMGDKAKMVNFQQDIQWLQDHKDDAAFFYTYFIGGAKRVHVEQTIGNYQSSKLVRAMLRAAIKRKYSFNSSRDMADLQAGILKKLGMNKANEGSNAQLAAQFDGLASHWTSLQKEHTVAGGTGFAPAIIEAAVLEDAGREGWMSLSAISEAMELYNHQNLFKQGKGKSYYKTGFITEIDGLANGLAINSLQAGDLRVAGLTGMIPLEDEKYSLENDDVYIITTSMFKQQINSYAGSNLDSQFGVIWEEAFDKLFNENDRSAYRKPSKTALMIFGYGAGDATIDKNFQEFLAEKIEGDKNLKAMIDSYGSKAMEKFLALSGKMMVKSIQTNFPEMQELAKVLSSITGYAASLGIEPHVSTPDNDWIEFGLSQRIKDKRFRGSYKQGNKKGRPGEITVQTMKRFLDSQGVEVTDSMTKEKLKVKFDSTVHRISSLKAAKQAPVLITQSIDALVMMRAIANLREKSKSKASFFAAQIYDGILMTPKDAREYSEALHKEILYISKHYSSIHNLIDSIAELDAGRFYEIARMQRREILGRDLTKKEEAELKKNPVKYFLAQVPWRGKKGDTIIAAINRIDKRRAEAVKKLDLKKMYQYAWDWPKT